MEILKTLNSYIWGWPLILLLLGTGIFLTVSLRGLQFRELGTALKLAFFRKRESGAEGDISHFQALMTALAATVGTGNIAGVATAIAVGGPGAIFWMWLTGFVGMATKFAEAILAVKYRIKDDQGNMAGGPMFYIEQIGPSKIWKILAVSFATFTVIASFGIGNMVQSNSVADAVERVFHFPPLATGIILGVLTALVILGGIKSIGKVTSVLVPVMVCFYFTAAAVVLVLNFAEIPAALLLIFEKAFSPTSATGGFLGATIMITIRMGVARGIFSNESGLGSSPIAAAAAQTKCPKTQALVSMTQTFIDTIIVCTMTALVIITSGEWTTGLTGAELTAASFTHGLGSSLGGIIVAVGLILFAYSSLLGWSYYGEKGLEYLTGTRLLVHYRMVFCVVVVLGAVSKLELVWLFSDIMNGLMAFPNLVALILLSGVIKKEAFKTIEGHGVME